MKEVGLSVGPNLFWFFYFFVFSLSTGAIFVLGVGYFTVWVNHIVILLNQLNLPSNLYKSATRQSSEIVTSEISANRTQSPLSG